MAISPTSASDVVGQRNKIGVINFGATLVLEVMNFIKDSITKCLFRYITLVIIINFFVCLHPSAVALATMEEPLVPKPQTFQYRAGHA